MADKRPDPYAASRAKADKAFYGCKVPISAQRAKQGEAAREKGDEEINSTNKKCPLPKTGLGPNVDKALAKCPSFYQEIKEQIEHCELKFEYSDHSGFSNDPPRIFINKTAKGKIGTVLGILAYQYGAYKNEPDPPLYPDGLLKEQYVEKRLTQARIQHIKRRTRGASCKLAWIFTVG